VLPSRQLLCLKTEKPLVGVKFYPKPKLREKLIHVFGFSTTFLFIFESYNSGKTEMDGKAVIAVIITIIACAFLLYVLWFILTHGI
jgi:hypothetical protein